MHAGWSRQSQWQWVGSYTLRQPITYLVQVHSVLQWLCRFVCPDNRNLLCLRVWTHSAGCCSVHIYTMLGHALQKNTHQGYSCKNSSAFTFLFDAVQPQSKPYSWEFNEFRTPDIRTCNQISNPTVSVWHGCLYFLIVILTHFCLHQIQ